MKKSLKILGVVFAIIVLAIGGFVWINDYLEEQEALERLEKMYNNKQRN